MLLPSITASVVALLPGRSPDVRQPTPDLIHFAAGRYSIFDELPKRNPELTVEYRFGEADWLPWSLPGLAPQVGVMRTSRDEVYTYAGLHYDLQLGSGWHLTPQLDIGHYEQGDGRTLCADLEFRSGIELSYELSKRMRLAVGLRHISNAGLADCNPGAESLLFGVQFAPFAD